MNYTPSKMCDYLLAIFRAFFQKTKRPMKIDCSYSWITKGGETIAVPIAPIVMVPVPTISAGQTRFAIHIPETPPVGTITTAIYVTLLSPK